MCQDGYTTYNEREATLNANGFPDDDEIIKQLLPLFTTCVKQKVPKDDYVSNGGWHSDTQECPPSWQDNDGGCKSGWYSN
jgi:hypothetical protein